MYILLHRISNFHTVLAQWRTTSTAPTPPTKRSSMEQLAGQEGQHRRWSMVCRAPHSQSAGSSRSKNPQVTILARALPTFTLSLLRDLHTGHSRFFPGGRVSLGSTKSSGHSSFHIRSLSITGSVDKGCTELRKPCRDFKRCCGEFSLPNMQCCGQVRAFCISILEATLRLM